MREGETLVVAWRGVAWRGVACGGVWRGEDVLGECWRVGGLPGRLLKDSVGTSLLGVVATIVTLF